VIREASSLLPRRRLEPIFDLGVAIVDHDNARGLRRSAALLIAPRSDEAPAPFIAASEVGDGSIAAEGLFERLRDRFGSQDRVRDGRRTLRSALLKTPCASVGGAVPNVGRQ